MRPDEFMIVLKNMRMILLFVYINIRFTANYWNFCISLFFNIFTRLRMRMLIVSTNLNIIKMFFKLLFLCYWIVKLIIQNIYLL